MVIMIKKFIVKVTSKQSMKHLSVRTGSFSNTNLILAISFKYSSCLCLLIVENYQKLLTWFVALT